MADRNPPPHATLVERSTLTPAGAAVRAPSPSGAFDRGLAHLVHETSVDEAAARRARQNVGRERLAHDTTFRAALADLGDRQAQVAVVGADGQRLSGRIGCVGRDFAAITGTRHWLVRLGAIVAVIDEPGAPRSTGPHRAATSLDRTWLEALHHLWGEPVVIWGATGPLASGVLRGCGRDVMRVESAPSRRSTYVNSQAVWAVGIEAELWGSAS